MTNSVPKKIIFFLVRFFVFAPVTLVIWWYSIPIYASTLGFLCVVMLRYLFWLPATGFQVNASGILNTGTLLELVVNDHRYPLPIAQLTTNIAPFVALMLASFKKTEKAWIRHLGWGIAVLVVSHLIYIVLAFQFRHTISLYPDIPTIVAEIFLTLPFLLWVLGKIAEKKVCGPYSE